MALEYINGLTQWQLFLCIAIGIGFVFKDISLGTPLVGQ